MTLSHTQVLLCAPATPLISPRLFILSILVQFPSVTISVRSLSDWLGDMLIHFRGLNSVAFEQGGWQTVGSSDEGWKIEWQGERVKESDAKKKQGGRWWRRGYGSLTNVLCCLLKNHELVLQRGCSNSDTRHRKNKWSDWTESNSVSPLWREIY